MGVVYFTCFFVRNCIVSHVIRNLRIKNHCYSNSYVIFWLAIELIFVFYAKLPVMNIKPLLFAHKKESVIHFVLMKSHFYLQYFPLLMIIPLGFSIYKRKLWDIKHYYLDVGMYLLALIVNYANFLIKKKFAKYHSLPSFRSYRTGVLVWIIMEF
jgi:hypothetical protein